MKTLLLLFAGLGCCILSFAQTPVISGFSPASGTSGTSIQISGNNFSSVNSVSFGGFPIARFTIVSPTSIVAVVGNGASGKITVTAPAGGAESTDSFSFLISNSSECIWIGDVDSLWDNPANWSCQKIPDSSCNVYIPGGTKYGPRCVGECNAKRLRLGCMNTIDSARFYLDLAYKSLCGDQGYGVRLSMYYTVDNDETVGPPGPSDNDRRDIAHYRASPANSQLELPFRKLYSGIACANYCIKYIPQMPLYNLGTTAEKNELRRMHGEALTLKAQCYFELIRNWGDVPYTADELDSSNIYIRVNGIFYGLPQTDRDSIYNILINELGLAETLLPWRSQLPVGYIDNTETERITRASAKALRARIALFAGGYSLRSNGIMQRPADYLSYYQIARQECAELMAKRSEHTLASNYKYLWKEILCAHLVNDVSGEFIFQIKMEGANGVSDSKLGYYNGPRVNNFGNRSINIVPSYFYLFDSTDSRRDVTCAFYNVQADGVSKIATAATIISDGKFRRDWISNPIISPDDVVQYFGLNWPLIRFSDVLLMYAEADNEIAGMPNPEAVAALNEVRARAYGSSSYAILPSTKSEFFDAIVKERLLEFGGEGIRKFDLLRWNLLEQKLNEAKANLNLMAGFSVPYSSLPVYMYYYTNASADDKNIWANSLYFPEPANTPAGTTKITWLSASNIYTFLGSFANGYTAHKTELLPFSTQILSITTIAQNPGY